MKRLFKWLGIAILSALFFMVVLLGIAYYYKSEILQAVDRELKRNINGDIVLGGLTFSLWDEYPGLSITLHDLRLRGPYYNRYGKDFFAAERVRINTRLLPLLQKTIEVRSIHVTNASIFIFRAAKGQSNMEIFKTPEKKDTASSGHYMSVLLRRLRLEEVSFSFQDSLKKKSVGAHFIDLRCRISQTDSISNFEISGPVKFNGLVLNPAKGAYLKEKTAKVQWKVDLISGKRQMIIHPSTMDFEKSQVNLEGKLDFAPPGKLLLAIRSAGINYDEGVSLLTPALQEKLAKIKIDKPVDVTVSIDGELTSLTNPRVDLSFKFAEATINAYGIGATNVTTEGSFINHVNSVKQNDDPNSRIRLDNLKGTFQGLTTTLTATLDDLSDPRLIVSTHLNVPLTDFKRFVDESQFRINSGRLISRMTYSGKLNEFLDTTKTHLEGKLNGTAQITNGALQFVPRKHIYEKVNVSVSFDQRRVALENVSFTINNSPVIVKGELLGFVPFFVLPDEKAMAKLNVYSPSLNLQPLLAIAPPKKAPGKPTANKKSAFNLLLEKLSQDVQFELNVQLDKLLFQNMRGYNVNGKFMLRNYALEAPNVSMNLADGSMAFAMSLANLDKSAYYLWVKSTIRQADIKKLFFSFDNFKLKTIQYENLEGVIDVRSILRCTVDDTFNPVVPTLYGNVDLVIRKGKLINFEPLENMSNFLFKKRDFSNVQFGELRSQIMIRGKEFDIERMEIESTVLRLFVEGRYSLTGHTDMEVQVPLSNLKKRDKTYKPENVGVDQKVGPSVFLHVHSDEKGNTVIAYDPFKRHAKKTPTKGKSATKAGSR